MSYPFLLVLFVTVRKLMLINPQLYQLKGRKISYIFDNGNPFPHAQRSGRSQILAVKPCLCLCLQDRHHESHKQGLLNNLQENPMYKPLLY